MRFVPFILILCFMPGCIPPTHTTVRSEEFRGKVLDERTHAPIQGAKIFLTEHQSVSCKSGPDGSYWLRKTFNWHPDMRLPHPEVASCLRARFGNPESPA